MESEESQQKCRESYSERRSYSLRDLKSREDWNEWQANALGAALLMPQAEIKRAMWLFAQCRTLISYEGRFSYADKLALSLLCQALGSIVVYEDTRGHVETKCKKCGKITVFDVLSMRKIVSCLRPKEN